MNFKICSNVSRYGDSREYCNVNFIKCYYCMLNINNFNYLIDDNINNCFSYYNGNCILCNTKIINGKCLKVSPIGCSLYNGYCKKCMENYYLDNNFECKKCPINCRKCNKNKCILCKNGFYGINCTKNNNFIQEKLYFCNNGYSNGKECNYKNLCYFTTINKCEICKNSILINENFIIITF